MLLLIDNYDSFTYNLAQMLGALNPDVLVVRNDERTLAELVALHPAAVVLSPGPGRPAEAGVTEDAVRAFAGRAPILGVCLGHQAICEAYGAKVGFAHRLMHGKTSVVEMSPASALFQGVAPRAEVARYHSLAAQADSMPPELLVTARTVDDGEVMAVQHRSLPVFGVQFHPESIMTPSGATILRNFAAVAGLIPPLPAARPARAAAEPAGPDHSGPLLHRAARGAPSMMDSGAAPTTSDHRPAAPRRQLTAQNRDSS